jgi:hypothetical protein
MSALNGLIVALPDSCSRCGGHVAEIGPGAGPHKASLRCAACETHRGWISGNSYAFLAEFVRNFGRPTEPIAIRRARRSIGFISSLDLITPDRSPPAISTVNAGRDTNEGEDQC